MSFPTRLVGNVIGLLLLSTGLVSCNNGPEIRKLHPGQSTTVFPVKNFSLAKSSNNYKHIFIHFNQGGKSVGYADKTKIEIYYKEDLSSPKYVFEARELKTMHQDTGCPKELEEFLENSYEGDAIFCNDKLDLEKMGKFRAIREGKRNKESTMYTVEGVFEEHDLIMIGVGLH